MKHKLLTGESKIENERYEKLKEQQKKTSNDADLHGLGQHLDGISRLCTFRSIKCLAL